MAEIFGRQRLQFYDPRTGKSSTGGKDVPEMNVVYLGKFVGTLRKYKDYSHHYSFTEAYPGTHNYNHFIRYLRTHLLRYFDSKYAKFGIDTERTLEQLADKT